MSEPADRAVPVLHVGYVPGVTLTKWRRVWSERFPRLGLEVAEVPSGDQRGVLEREEVDLCFVRLPVITDGLHVIPLYEEVPVVVVPKDHPVSLFDAVALAELSEEEVVEPLESSLTSSGHAETAELFDLVAGGAGIAFVPQSVARSHSRRDLVYRPVSDGEPTRVALAWVIDNPHPMIEEFIGIVRGRTANSSRSASSRPVPTAAPVKPRKPSSARRAAGTATARRRRGR